ncbi:MAG: hypothetical protein ACK4HQ_03985 [Brevinematales bacterium]
MKKHLLFLFSLLAIPLSAKSPISAHTIAIDLSWTTEGLVNEGIGWGMLIDFSLHPNFFVRLRHGVVETEKIAIEKRVANYVFSSLIGYKPWEHTKEWFRGFFIATGFGYDQVITTDPFSGSVADHFLLPFVDISTGYRFVIGRIIIEPSVSILLPLVEPERSKTGIALYTRHVDLEGLSIGILF